MEGNKLETCFLPYWEMNEAQCTQKLSDLRHWNMIQSLNSVALHEVMEQQLVRFMGMIQDMQNPELFLEQYEVRDSISGQTTIKISKYREVLACEPNEVFVEDSSNNVQSERHLFYCTPVPALTPWVQQYLVTDQHRQSETNLLHQKKRSHPDEGTSGNEMICSTSSSSAMTTKRLCTNDRLVSSMSSCSTEHNSPPQATPCLVKVYNGDSTFALNDVIEVVGFLSVTPAVSVFSDAMEEDEELRLHGQPDLQVPRLHAVCVRKLKHNNPLLHCTSFSPVMALQLARMARQDLYLVLSQVLLGDDLAANYVICHLISRVFYRSDLLALGKFSLNISNVVCGDNYATKLYAVLEQLVTKSHYLPLTLENMNSCAFVPVKNYEANRLMGGVLQLSPQTHLVLDETCLQPGQLDSNGVNNVAALGTLISQQKLDYDFKFYKLEFQTDIPVLVLSEGKSLLPSDVHVPLEPDSRCLETRNEIFEAVEHYLQEPVVQRIRKYLTVVLFLEYSFPQHMEQIQDDFVRMRRENRATTSASDLHLLLVLARLISLSSGEPTMSKESWELACTMETQRKQRIDGQVRLS